MILVMTLSSLFAPRVCWSTVTGSMVSNSATS